MKFTLTSISKKILETDNLESANIPTKSWYITVQPNHEALISALNPGILTIKYGWKTLSFAIWWWVLETDWLNLSILADMVEDWSKLDIEEIQKKKKEAQELMEKYREENKTMDMDRYIELEMQFLKESAKEQLALK